MIGPKKNIYEAPRIFKSSLKRSEKPQIESKVFDRIHENCKGYSKNF